MSVGEHFRILSSISTLRVPEDVDLFPAKMYSWLAESDDSNANVLGVLENTVTQGCAEW